MTRKKIDTLTTKEQAILHRLGRPPSIFPILDMNSNMAYIFGVINGDATIHSGRYIILTTKDHPFAQSFADALAQINLRPVIRRVNGRNLWKVDSCSKLFVEWYEVLTLDEMFGMVDVDRDYLLHFFRGFYESEGCLFQKLGYNPRIHVTSTNISLLIMLAYAMRKLGYRFNVYQKVAGERYSYIQGQVIHSTKPIYDMLLQRQVEVKKLLEAVKPCIWRKMWQKE